MCGIFGIVSATPENIHEKIINGLIQLQNRGYDSSGLCVLNNNHLEVHKYASTVRESSLQKLQQVCVNMGLNTLGIGHNRWATHGVKNDTNAHPHVSNNKQFAVVHNGIIENYAELKQDLINNGFTFFSQTDTEIIVNLISFFYDKLGGNTQKSIEATVAKLQGTYGIIVMDAKSPNKLFCVRNGSPLLVGKSDDCIIITSEQSGFCNLVSNYITLHNDDICVIERTDALLLVKTSGTYTGKKVLTTVDDLSPHPFAHWTLKEIWYQPTVVLNAINNGGRIDGPSRVKLGGLDQHINILKDVCNIIILGCGTSYFAGLYGMHFFKRLCNLNTVQVFDGAEFSNYDIPRVGKTAIILVSQSGETKDLHRCIEHQGNAVTIGVINVVDSLIAREVDCGVYCNAGKEVGVASTKAFTSQVVCLSLMAIWFSQLHGVNEHLRTRTISDLQNLSNDFKNTIENVEPVIETLSSKLINAKNIFILGKGSDECIAREGSLKIKEISYVHAEGYSASSLKHGPFALLDETFPVIILDLDSRYEAKIKNCVEEVKSRGSPVVLISNQGEIRVSANSSYSSLLGLVPIQLLAYYLSVQKGINPDKPKNLAKVVTVE